MALMVADIWQIDKDAQGHVTKEKLFGVMVRQVQYPVCKAR